MAADDVGVFRAHLSLRAERVNGEPDKLARLRDWLAATDGGGAIVFVNDKVTAQRLHDALSPDHLAALIHPGQSEQLRRTQREGFLLGETRVLVTTPLQHALNRRDVRLVLHHDWPTTLNTYSRQVMEAARDGKPGCAVLLCDPDGKDGRRPQAGDSLHAFARTASCRWKWLLEHVGDDVAFTRCGACDNCDALEATTRAAITGQAAAPWPDQEMSPLDAHHTSMLREGLAVAVHRHGWGWVHHVDESLVSVDFPDGHSGRFTPGHVHPLSSRALDFAARLLPGQVAALRHHEGDQPHADITYHQLLAVEQPRSGRRHVSGALLGPSDSSDSGSDVAWWMDDEHASLMDDGDGQDFSSDANGTGEGCGMGAGRSAADILPDRIRSHPDQQEDLTPDA